MQAAWGKKEAYPELEVLLNDIEDFNKPWNGPEQRAPWGKRAVGDWQDARGKGSDLSTINGEGLS